MFRTTGRRRTRRLLLPAGLAAAAVLLLAGPASAHVLVSSPDAAPGADGTLVFQVPTESATASTVGLQVTLPAATPFAEVSAQTHPGWTVRLTRVKLDRPIRSDDETFTSAVRAVTWTAARGQGVRPGQFDTFELAVGPFPDARELSFPTRQTYSDGKVVEWVQSQQSGQDEPEHPAPQLALGGAVTMLRTATATSADRPADLPARILGGAGLVAGLAALGVSLQRRRRA